MSDAYKGYMNGTYNRGLANVMQPVINTITTKDMESVSAYLKKNNK